MSLWPSYGHELQASGIFIVFFDNKFPSFWHRVYWLYPLKGTIFIYVVFSLKFMPFFNETIVTKKLRNIIDIFYENCKTWAELLSTLMLRFYHKKWDKIQDGISVITAKFFFQFKIMSLWKDWKNGFFYFQKVSLNEI